MKWIRKCPLFIILVSTGILFTIIGISGRQSVYAGQEYDPLKAPVLSVMFAAVNDGIYPWHILERETVLASGNLSGEETGQEIEGEGEIPPSDGEEPPLQPPVAKEEETDQEEIGEEEETESLSREEPPESGDVSGNDMKESMDPAPENPEQIPEGRLEPLRESTHEEYLNHISADIYGDAGVIRAAAYDFSQVDESYFDDALFIGDSRTVGLRDYTSLPEHADFYCETSLTVYKVLEEDFKGLGTIREALEAKDYGKIYLMVGINELGRGTTEDYMEKYTEVVDTLRAWEPDAKLIIQGVMHVSGEKNSKDPIFNNSNINARNNAVATLADNKDIFYIDVNEVVCDEEGNLNEEYTFDQIHLLGVYNDLWKEFLLSHGV
ncbi:MAG: hypothetical protein K2P07_02165 [Lachnospiraceae bacterium]|nr:hypothetical protein [Lachnospiraceae bacterium]MDE7006954.1 hypothetical protein [Lachnospiraceae bacterium]